MYFTNGIDPLYKGECRFGDREATQEETDAFELSKQPSAQELMEVVRNALQAAIDFKAQTLGFSGGNALMLYAGFENHYRSVAQVFAAWEASVWVAADAYKADVLAGTKPMLTGPEAVALMPAYPEE